MRAPALLVYTLVFTAVHRGLRSRHAGMIARPRGSLRGVASSGMIATRHGQQLTSFLRGLVSGAHDHDQIASPRPSASR